MRGDKGWHILRIPKTGSRYLSYILQGDHFQHPHEFNLWMVPRGADAIACVRDPVQRFRSAYDMYRKDEKLNIPDNVDEFIAQGPYYWAKDVFGSAFRPQTWWLHSAAYVAERGATILHTETLSEELVAMGCKSLPLNHWAYHAAANPRADKVNHVSTVTNDGPIREHYAGDYRLLEELGNSARQ